MIGGLDIIAYCIAGFALAHMGATILFRVLFACYDCAKKREQREREDANVIGQDEFASDYKAWRHLHEVDD